jgi:hypothetical protein
VYADAAPEMKNSACSKPTSPRAIPDVPATNGLSGSVIGPSTSGSAGASSGGLELLQPHAPEIVQAKPISSRDCFASNIPAMFSAKHRENNWPRGHHEVRSLDVNL